jgi:hypothetical protein
MPKPINRRARKCAKVRYVCKADALAALRLTNDRLVTTDGRTPVSVYYCKKCRGFHLTSWTQEEYHQRRAS